MSKTGVCDTSVTEMHDTTMIERFIYDNDFSPSTPYTALALLALFVILALCLFRSSWRKWIFHYLKWIAASVFAAGIMVYTIGFNWEGSANNLLVLFLRASVSSLEMFVSESDLIEVKEELKKSQLYMTVFSVTHFLAVFVSAIFIIRLFGLRLMSMIRLWLYGVLRSGYECYVFWGVNEKALTVAESMPKDNKALLVFVKMPGGKRHHSSRFTFSHFFHTVDDGIEEYVERIERLNKGKLKTFITVADAPVDMAFAESCKSLNPLKKIRLNNLRRCMCKMGKTEFFLLSDDERKNMETVCALKDLLTKTGDWSQISTVYCHCRENRLNRSVLKDDKETGPKICLVDSSMLAVRQLMADGGNHPVNFVRRDEATGTVSTVFTAMIIGFGETGRDMFRFLYEFGSFIKETRTGDDGKDDVVEQDKRIYVADGRLRELKTKFIVNAPALADKDSIEWLEGVSTRDAAFWDKMKEIVNALNYVVITVDDDEEAAFIAVQVFEFAHRYRDNMDMFKVYVRLRDDDGKRLLEQISKYRTTISGKETKQIEAFGTDKKVFSYSNLNKVSQDKEANLFKDEYGKIYDEISRDWPQDVRKERLDAVTKSFKEHYNSEQNHSNVNHIHTKLALAGIDVNNKNDAKRKRLIKGTKDDTNEGCDKALLDNLAYCEHVRWNAKTELLGFVYGEEKLFKRKTHNCLLSCNRLIRSADPYVARTVRFDKAIVELSLEFKINQDDNDRQGNNQPADS